MITITEVLALDIRFPTSKDLDGSDAVNTDPDYSAAYVILKTNREGLEGHGLTFTTGRGNEICVTAIRSLSYLVKGRTLESITSNYSAFWASLTRGDSQLRWLGPEKGVIHLAAAALVNATWDLYAKSENKPLWKLLYDLTPEQVLSCLDFTYLTDEISPEEALAILIKAQEGKEKRLAYLEENGFPAYTTSAGWLGYSDEKLRRLCREAVAEGWKYLKMKVGSDPSNDQHRAAIIREETGPDMKLMMDANQKWEVDEAIRCMKALSRFDPWWIEEPTSPDDIAGHKKIKDAIFPIGVATGEHVHNRVMFKQFLAGGAMDFCQVDVCRLAGINETLMVMILAAKHGIPVCPHAGGVGLCEYVQHLSMFDFMGISGQIENRILEYVDHLHEHFIDPVVIRQGAYRLPARPGCSIEMKEESLREYEFSGQ
ncbi:MAG TPA: enolase C-terminal domain-like protein [Saprospiraceae bacterium]|nr:enolase C-terminal domain-like protein [Saprospiraceae bacterium]HNT19017.1 enolase C-terminal domain-like protein [Saprospiraceae bacterium]